MTAACKARVRARCGSDAPSARLTADDTPPPMAPADIIWTRVANGKTSAMAANGTVPSTPT
jgi:hypothetical protein